MATDSCGQVFDIVCVKGRNVPTHSGTGAKQINVVTFSPGRMHTITLRHTHTHMHTHTQIRLSPCVTHTRTHTQTHTGSQTNTQCTNTHPPTRVYTHRFVSAWDLALHNTVLIRVRGADVEWPAVSWMQPPPPTRHHAPSNRNQLSARSYSIVAKNKCWSLSCSLYLCRIGTPAPSWVSLVIIFIIVALTVIRSYFQ